MTMDAKRKTEIIDAWKVLFGRCTVCPPPPERVLTVLAHLTEGLKWAIDDMAQSPDCDDATRELAMSVAKEMNGNDEIMAMELVVFFVMFVKLAGHELIAMNPAPKGVTL